MPTQPNCFVEVLHSDVACSVPNPESREACTVVAELIATQQKAEALLCVLLVIETRHSCFKALTKHRRTSPTCLPGASRVSSTKPAHNVPDEATCSHAEVVFSASSRVEISINIVIRRAKH